MVSVLSHTGTVARARMAFVSADGATLVGERFGDAAAPAVLFAHGFGQTRQAWAGAAQALAVSGWQAITFDARGHGESDRVPGGAYHLDQFIADLDGLARSLPQPPVLVGASMGGLLGITVAGASVHPPLRALVLVDITPRWEPAGVERILAFMRAFPDGFASYEAVADAIAAYLPQRRERKSASQLAPLLRLGDDGRLRWHWDPALLDVVAAEGASRQPQLLEAARRIAVPTLLISGGSSDVVSAATVNEFLSLVPHARHVAIARATHMVAGDANDAFSRAILDFLATLPMGATAPARSLP